jgi:hypothetical protein
MTSRSGRDDVTKVTEGCVVSVRSAKEKAIRPREGVMGVRRGVSKRVEDGPVGGPPLKRP